MNEICRYLNHALLHIHIYAFDVYFNLIKTRENRFEEKSPAAATAKKQQRFE